MFCETTPYDPRSPYSASKAGADHLVRAWGHTYGLPVLVTNCSNNYGPYHVPEKLIPLIIIRALAGEPMPVYGDGSNIREVTVPETGAFAADWSPDGRSLALSDHCCNPVLTSIVAIQVDGKNLRRLTNNGGTFNDLRPSWAPEGNAIVFYRRNIVDNTVGIWVIDARRKSETLIRTLPAAAVLRPRPKRFSRGHARSSSAAAKDSAAKDIEQGGVLPRWGAAQ